MNSLANSAKILFAALVLLPLLSGNTGAQEVPTPALDPEIPWFKVEVIVFRDLREIPDDEVFTPPPSAIISSPAQDESTGVIDARALGQSGHSNDEAESDSDIATAMGDAEVPAFGDTLPLMDTEEDAEQDPAQSEDDSIVPGSYFRLVAIEEVFPQPLAENQVPPPVARGPRADPKTGMSPGEAADYALMHELELTKEGKRIRDSRNFELLAHMAWIQPGYARENAIAFPLAELAGPASGLHGDLTLHLSRYLHLQFDLAIDELPKTPGEQSTTPLDALVAFPGSWGNRDERVIAPEYRINEKRRMRSGELHYIDHPRFGVLTRISKVKPELIQANADLETDLPGQL